MLKKRKNPNLDAEERARVAGFNTLSIFAGVPKHGQPLACRLGTHYQTGYQLRTSVPSDAIQVKEPFTFNDLTASAVGKGLRGPRRKKVNITSLSEIVYLENH